MKVITTGLLNRFWTKGIKPWLDKRIKSYADLMVTTASGYTPDALAVKEGFTELNGKLDWFDMKNISGTYTITGTKTNIEICRVSLAPGTWLILGFLDGNISKEIVYNNAIFRGTLKQHCQTIRNSLVSGGGSINVYPITIQTNTDIILGTYDDFDLKGVVFKGTLYAIRLKN